MSEKPILWRDAVATDVEPAGREKLPLYGELWTVEETARYLKVAKSSIYRWAANGTIGHFKTASGGIRVSGVHIREFLEYRTADLENELADLDAGGYDSAA